MKAREVVRMMFVILCFSSILFASYAVTQWIVCLVNPEAVMIGCSLAR
jgi:hypothetical protein